MNSQNNTSNSKIDYSNLLKKIRLDSNDKICHIDESQSSETDKTKHVKMEYDMDGFVPVKRNKHMKEQVRIEEMKEMEEIGEMEEMEELEPIIYSKVKNSLPKLSTRDYISELYKCHDIFYLRLNEYLKTEVIYKTRPSDDKKEPVIIKKTNLERIQSGAKFNVLNLFYDTSPDAEYKYLPEVKFLDNMIANKKMDFHFKLANYMKKFNIMVTFKNKNNIILHSPHLLI